MTVQRHPDQVLAAWLDEGPMDLPDSTRRAILTALPTTPQARRRPTAPWWLGTMTPVARMAAAIGVIVVALGGVYVLGSRNPAQTGAPTPSALGGPSASPVSTTSWQTITSRRFGISFKAPAGWAVTLATAPWPYAPDSFGAWLAGSQDVALRADSGADVSVSSQPVPKGMSDSQWLLSILGQGRLGDLPGCWPKDVNGFMSVQVDGQPALSSVGAYGCSFAVAFAFDGGRAYVLLTDGIDDVATHTVNRGFFDAWLSTVHLDPAGADDLPAPTASPRASP